MNKLEKLHEFESEKKAIQLLKSFGFDDEQIYYFKFKEKEPTPSGNEISSEKINYTSIIGDRKEVVK